MEYVCPKCKRAVLSRRHKNCQYCSAELPKEFLLTESEIAKDNQDWEKMQQDRMRRQLEADIEEKARQNARRGMI
jgi:hypothetical protein